MHLFCFSVQKNFLDSVMFGFSQLLQVCNEWLSAVLKQNFEYLGWDIFMSGIFFHSIRPKHPVYPGGCVTGQGVSLVTINVWKFRSLNAQGQALVVQLQFPALGAWPFHGQAHLDVNNSIWSWGQSHSVLREWSHAVIMQGNICPCAITSGAGSCLGQQVLTPGKEPDAHIM